jgi:Uma2 family endonuclease
MSHALARREQTVLVPDARRGPLTVNDLFEMPCDDGRRYEVLGGWLIVSPSASPEHQYASGEIFAMLREALSRRAAVVTTVAVALPDGDGPVPDLVVADTEYWESPKGVPVARVHTVIEIVSPSNASRDRRQKRWMYAIAGIPCYWRLERQRWRGYRGPTPALVVGLLRDGQWDETVYPVGAEADVPVVFGRRSEDVMVVKLDPAVLLPRR